MRGSGLPDWASGVTLPISTNPNPIFRKFLICRKTYITKDIYERHILICRKTYTHVQLEAVLGLNRGTLLFCSIQREAIVFSSIQREVQLYSVLFKSRFSSIQIEIQFYSNRGRERHVNQPRYSIIALDEEVNIPLTWRVGS